MRLSILIATINERHAQFNALLHHLEKQALPQVEVLSLADNKEISIGIKRQRLLEIATGDYIVFVDDDDWVADNYVAAIMQAIAHRPDCIGFRLHCCIDGAVKNAIGSLRYRHWESCRDGFDYVRSIYHKNPVKRELALQTGFNDLRYAEDIDYSKRLQQWLSTEYFIDEQLYFYRYISAVPHNAKYGICPSG